MQQSVVVTMNFSLVVFSTCFIGILVDSVVYHVLPTEPLTVCPGNSSCQPGQCCHTMDYFVEHNSEFFSPNHVNVTLMFMCGVHNYTKELTVQNFNSFVMKGVAESRGNVIIQFVTQKFGKPSCTIIQFFNVSSIYITNLTMRCPSMLLKYSNITIESSNLYGYTDANKSLSIINTSGRYSRALLDNCTFKINCFIVSKLSEIIVSNSTFHSYKHRTNSIIKSHSSTVTLIGNVNFTDSVTAIFLDTIHPELKSSINITASSVVFFINLQSKKHGGAVYGENGIIHIGVKARVVYMHNGATGYGGAVYLRNGNFSIGRESNVLFAYNRGFYNGGAISLSYGVLTIESNASLTFSHNSAVYSGGAVHLRNSKLIANNDAIITFNNNSVNRKGGAISLENSTINVDTHSIHFYNNSAASGGAMYLEYGTMHINSNKSVMFTTNTAHLRGGAIYVESGVHSAIIVHNSARLLLFNNTAFQGGALYTNMIPSFAITVRYQSIVQLKNNRALDVGGAVYSQFAAPCLFMVTDYSAEISFVGNSAQPRGIGQHMYGASVRYFKCDSKNVQFVNKQGKPYCWRKNVGENVRRYINISFSPSPSEILSPISSAPLRVCLCDPYGKPQCTDISQIFPNISIYRGETFTLTAHIVGYDFGTTIGAIHANFLDKTPFSRLEKSEYSQQANNSKVCSSLSYTVYSKRDDQVLLLKPSILPVSVHVGNRFLRRNIAMQKAHINQQISYYKSYDQHGCINEDLLTTPVFVNVSLLQGCPPGLILNLDHTECSCYNVLANNGFKCSIQSKVGYFKWSNTAWVAAMFNDSKTIGVVYNRFCPPPYCKVGEKTINISMDSIASEQCASNRTGILCGACMENYSLAIGSSQCIECTNSHNLALLLAFAAAGVFLVLFILVFNLTVTQGLINGSVFYANIVWAYKITLFPSDTGDNHPLTFLQVYIAWFNLDFGIESCFINGLDAFWKTWLQFLFPLYIWVIAGVIIVACRYSFYLTRLIGSRAVPLLATLFLLSYMKLLRTVIDATSVAVIEQYPQNTSYSVWYLDGNLTYCHSPHIYLFIVAIAMLVFLWLPYTLLLLFIQPLRRMSHLRPLKWINKLAPVFDAHFAPLKDKHQYWFGTMLLIRGILLIILTATSAANPEMNILILLVTISVLAIRSSVNNIYKRINVRIFEGATLLNLIVLSAGTLYNWEHTKSQMILLKLSIGISFAQFCIIAAWSLIKTCLSAGWRCRKKQTYDVTVDDMDDDLIVHERIDELQPLISKRNNN